MNRQLILVLNYIIKAISITNNTAQQVLLAEATRLLVDIEADLVNIQTLVDINNNAEANDLYNQINDCLDKNKNKEALILYSKFKKCKISNKQLVDDLETKLFNKLKLLVI